jgi:hypothetical protein
MSVTKDDIDKSLNWIQRFHAAGDARKPQAWIDTFWHPDAVSVNICDMYHFEQCLYFRFLTTDSKWSVVFVMA